MRRRWPLALAAAAVLLAVIVIVVVLAVILTTPSSVCSERAPRARYSSKTAYALVHGNANTTASDRQRGCEPVYVWHVLRHGTRYPSAQLISRLQESVAALQTRLADNVQAGRVQPSCEAGAQRMLRWRLAASPDLGNRLHPQGEKDLHGVGARLWARLPAFFGPDRLPDAFTFRSTDTERTIQSAMWYGRGLFNHEIALPTPLAEDPLLKFYDMCPAWDSAVDSNKTVQAEVTAFREGPVMLAALERISSRLGFSETLQYEEVNALYEACRYDQSWNPADSKEAAWCAAFDDEDLLVFEYHADMKYYYVDGYGSEMNLQLGCPLVKDLVDKFSAWEGGARTQKGSMYFTHSTAVHMTLARLGLGRDAEPLTAAGYNRLKASRQWVISKLAPFAANLAVVLYECQAGERLKMRMFLNEHVVRPEGCTDPTELCSWSDFKARFQGVTESCSLAFCNGVDVSTSPSAQTALAAE